MINSTKIQTIQNGVIQEGGKDKRQIPIGLFKPHMTFMLSGKTGSGKSTALLNMVKSYTDNDVFQKIVETSFWLELRQQWSTTRRRSFSYIAIRII